MKKIYIYFAVFLITYSVFEIKTEILKQDQKNNSILKDSTMFKKNTSFTQSKSTNISGNIIDKDQNKKINIFNTNNTTNYRNKRKIDGDIKYTWNFPIKYFVENAVNGSMVDEALKLLEKESCVRFQREHKLFKNSQGLRYYFGPGCFSYVGKQTENSIQDVSVGQNCDTIGTIQHETLHALGFDHEQCRADRDNFLKIFPENIQLNGENNFYKLKKDKSITFGTSFDYGSVMQYTSTSFSRNGEPTMLPTESLYSETLGLDEKASFLDIAVLNHYYCREKCNSNLECENGGYQDPNNCKICKCVEGFTGTLCDEIPPPTESCVQTFYQVTSVSQSLTIHGSKNCIYHLLANEGEKIELTIEKARFSPAFFPVCYLENSLELKYLADKTVTGAVICGGKLDLVVTSQNHHLMIHYRSSQSDNGALMTFKSYKEQIYNTDKAKLQNSS